MRSSRRWGRVVVLLVVGCSKGGDKPASGGYGDDFLGGFLNHDGGASPDAAGPPGDSGVAMPEPELELPKYMGRIVISPAAALFTKVGETASLHAEAFDAAGQKMAMPLSW
jgi:hypothetical protein